MIQTYLSLAIESSRSSNKPSSNVRKVGTDSLSEALKMRHHHDEETLNPHDLCPVACMKMHDEAAGHAGSVPSSGSLERAPSAISSAFLDAFLLLLCKIANHPNVLSTLSLARVPRTT